MKRFISIMMVLVMVFTLAACTKSGKDASPGESETKQESEVESGDDQKISFEPGKYTGTAEGHNGSVEVEVEVSEDAIVAVKVINSAETEHLAKVVFEKIPAQIIETQSLAADTVAGATITSAALKSAITDAVTKGNGNIELLKKAPEKQVSTEVVQLETDVVVIGGGAAGLSAALSIEQSGLSVILIEKNAMLGGHTALSGGLTLVTGSKLQEEMGVTNDTSEKAYDDIMKNGGDKSVPELLKVYCDNMGEATDWTIDYINAKIPDALTKLGENSVDRGLFYAGAGSGLIEALSAKLGETTVELHLDTKATTLITDESGVIGVEAKGKDGTTYMITAKATVLASGGYAARKDLLPEELQNFVYYGASLSSGDGITMGQDVGADTVNMGYVELFENGVEWKPGIAKSTYNGSMVAWDVSGILVDRNGKRVVNERGSGPEIVAQQSAQEDGTLFLLMDQATFDHFSENIGGTGISQEMLASWVENNGKDSPVFAHGETIEEVAKIVGIDAGELEKTMEKYNQYVKNGVDEEFNRAAEYLTAEIGAGPYYLVEQKPRYATTLGGLLINKDMQVINVGGEVIAGLYSVGDTAGGVRGDDSVPGSDVGWAITSGYLLGEILPENIAA